MVEGVVPGFLSLLCAFYRPFGLGSSLGSDGGDVSGKMHTWTLCDVNVLISDNKTSF